MVVVLGAVLVVVVADVVVVGGSVVATGTQRCTPAASIVVTVEGQINVVVVTLGIVVLVVVVLVVVVHPGTSGLQPATVVVVEVGAEPSKSTLRMVWFPESATNRFPNGSMPSP